MAASPSLDISGQLTCIGADLGLVRHQPQSSGCRSLCSHVPAGMEDAISLLEPLLTDAVDYVRQGALIATALVLMQQPESQVGA